MEANELKIIGAMVRENWGKLQPVYIFSDDSIVTLKHNFMDIYKSVILERGQIPTITEKELRIIRCTFNWAISSPDFEGDLQKGIYLASAQGFGKDVLMTTIIRFLAQFEMSFKRSTYDDFMMSWFEKVPAYFNGLIAINDIDEYGKIKRERESIPFLELLNYREQINNRKGLIVSTNLLPIDLQKQLEKGRIVQKLEQRIIECFNILKIEKAESKRRESRIEF